MNAIQISPHSQNNEVKKERVFWGFFCFVFQKILNESKWGEKKRKKKGQCYRKDFSNFPVYIKVIYAFGEQKIYQIIATIVKEN